MADINIGVSVTESGADEAAASLAKLETSVSRLAASSLRQATAAQKQKNALDQQAKSARGAASAIDSTARATDKAAKAQENYLVHISKTTILSALVNKSFLGLQNSMAKAVEQIDLVQNFPAAMGALGISAEEASGGMRKLQGYVQSVGGDLGEATRAVSRFAQVNGSIVGSVAMYAGINNALAAGGTPAQTQAAALEQLSQAYAKGKFDGEEFKSVNTAMGLAMRKTADELNLANTQALQDSLNEGTISMNEFVTKLAEVSTTGNIADAATAQMTGIGFAATVMSNTLTQGLTNIYAAVGRQNIIAFFRLLTDVIMVLAQWVVVLINAFRWLWAVLTGQKFEAVTGETADQLKAGAGAAGEMGKNLDDAGKSAKKLRNQLAAFDKMNVLTEPPESGSKDKGGAGTGGFDAGQLGALQSIFDNLPNGLREASLWAKILAGILIALATNAAIDKLFGVNPLKGLRDSLMGTGKDADKAAASMKKAGDEIDKTNKKAAGLGGTMKGVGKEADGLEKSSGKLPVIFGKIPINPLTVVAAALAAVGAGILYLYTTNEDFKRGFDNTFGQVLKVLQDIGSYIGDKLIGAIKWIGEQLDGIAPPDFSNFLKSIDEMENAGAAAGVVMGGLAIAVTLAPIAFAAQWAIAKGKVLLDWGVLLARSVVYGATEAWNMTAGARAFAAEWALKAAIVLRQWAAMAVEAAVKGAAIGLSMAQSAITTAAQWAVTFGKFVAGLAVMAGQLAVQAARMAASWLVAMGPIGWIIAAVVALVALIIIYWDEIKAAFAAAWEWIAGVFSAGVSWLMENVIKPIGAFFNGLWEGIKKVFSSVKTWFTEMFKGAWSGIKNIWSAVGGWFSGIWNGIKSIFSSVGSWFSGVFSSAWNNIRNIFGNVVGFFSGIWGSIRSVFSSIGFAIGDAISGGFRSVVNGVLGFIDSILGNIVNGINRMIDGVARVIPAAGGLRLWKPYIPRLAKGGVVNQPTIAEVGEAGAEAVVPLENNTEWIDQIAGKLDSAMAPQRRDGIDAIPDTRDKRDGDARPVVINLSGVFATSEQEKRKVAEEIYKYIQKAERARGARAIG